MKYVEQKIKPSIKSHICLVRRYKAEPATNKMKYSGQISS